MDSDSYIEDIKRKWDNLHEKGEAFAYKLDVKKYMILKGKYGIYCEVSALVLLFYCLKIKLISAKSRTDN